jgi:hypothetical protein
VHKGIGLNDCVTSSTEVPEKALRDDNPMFSEQMTSADLIAELTAKRSDKPFLDSPSPPSPKG